MSQLQQHLLSAQTEAEETHAAAKLRQIEHENQTHELEQVVFPYCFVCLRIIVRPTSQMLMLITTALLMYNTDNRTERAWLGQTEHDIHTQKLKQVVTTSSCLRVECNYDKSIGGDDESMHSACDCSSLKLFETLRQNPI